MKTWEQAIKLVTEYATVKHAKQKRMGGAAYITHPIEVAAILGRKGFSAPYVFAGISHDLLEDTDATIEELIAFVQGLPGADEAIEGIQLVTKEPGYIMQVYAKAILEHSFARMLKLADRLHNLITAIDGSLKFQKRYIEETQMYYVEMAKGTVFEVDIQVALDKLIEHVKLRESQYVQ